MLDISIANDLTPYQHIFDQRRITATGISFCKNPPVNNVLTTYTEIRPYHLKPICNRNRLHTNLLLSHTQTSRIFTYTLPNYRFISSKSTTAIPTTLTQETHQDVNCLYFFNGSFLLICWPYCNSTFLLTHCILKHDHVI